MKISLTLEQEPKRYVACLLQKNEDAPIAVVMKTDFDKVVEWIRNDVGMYEAICEGVFTEGKTFAVAHVLGDDTATVKHNIFYSENVNSCKLNVFNVNGIYSDNIGCNNLIQSKVIIEVYP